MDDREHLDVILAMCRRLLRPVVRVLLRHGITYRHFAALSKALYVEVASTDYGLRGRPTNVARTALLTGLDRKEVKRLRDAMYVDAGEARRYARGDRIARVLAAWYQDPRYRLGEK